jgi:hypothetical protein
MTTPERADADSSTRITVIRNNTGWELREERVEETGNTVRSNTYTDWHRLERALARARRQDEESRKAG